MSGNKRYKNRIANIQRKGEDKEYFEDEEDKDKISESQGMLTREKTSAQGNHQSVRYPITRQRINRRMDTIKR